MEDKISVIIPTYNRFKYVLNAIHYIKNQTYTNIEIIVINDCSTQKEYYEYDWKDVTIIHLPQNSKTTFGYPSCGYVRNQGLKCASGKYVAFCDDDDIWLPNKLEIQIKKMIENGYKISCTEAYIGYGVYNPSQHYWKYNADYYYHQLKDIYINNGSTTLEYGFPDIWDFTFLQIHNCALVSSVVIEKELLHKINNFEPMDENNTQNCDVWFGKEDWNCWLRALEYTTMLYIKEPCIYYDNSHGDGRDY